MPPKYVQVQIPSELAATMKELGSVENFCNLAAEGRLSSPQRRLRLVSAMHRRLEAMIVIANFCLSPLDRNAGQVGKVVQQLSVNWEFVNAVDRDGHTALHAAAAQGHCGVAEVLLERGANPSVQDVSRRYYHVFRGSATAYRCRFLHRNTHIVVLTPVEWLQYEGMSPLHWAVEGGNPDAVALLLKRGADPLVRSNTGQTAYDLIAALKPKAQAAMLGLLKDPATMRRGSVALGSPLSPNGVAMAQSPLSPGTQQGTRPGSAMQK